MNLLGLFVRNNLDISYLSHSLSNKYWHLLLLVFNMFQTFTFELIFSLFSFSSQNLLFFTDFLYELFGIVVQFIGPSPFSFKVPFSFSSPPSLPFSSLLFSSLSSLPLSSLSLPFFFLTKQKSTLSDLLMRLAKKLSPLDLELIIVLVKNAGHFIRSEDPGYFFFNLILFFLFIFLFIFIFLFFYFSFFSFFHFHFIFIFILFSFYFYFSFFISFVVIYYSFEKF